MHGRASFLLISFIRESIHHALTLFKYSQLVKAGWLTRQRFSITFGLGAAFWWSHCDRFFDYMPVNGKIPLQLPLQGDA
jgi:hypothetical protein